MSSCSWTKCKFKNIRVTGSGGLQGCGTWRLTHFLDNRLTDDGEVVSLTCRTPFTSGRSLVLISVRGWVGQGHYAARRHMSIEKIQLSDRESNPRPYGLQHSAWTNYATTYKCNIIQPRIPLHSSVFNVEWTIWVHIYSYFKTMGNFKFGYSTYAYYWSTMFKQVICNYINTRSCDYIIHKRV
jgi:hypothetical protein